ncbi:hypothetical protein ACFXKI_10080 [Streptomyces mirabilis]|uniref:hypothetical protein n=1 Tax=Streptomyces mirabilis TaxID=68239 RepID=UPI0036C650E4
MTCQTSGADVAACLFLSVGIFGTSLIPFFLLVDADFAELGRSLRAGTAAAVRPTREALRDAAALVLLLTTSPKGATHV